MRQNHGHLTLKRRSQRLIEARTSKKKRLLRPESTIHWTLMTLPTEILLLIIESLSLPWKFSLALTSKYFTELTHRNTLPRLEGEELIEFLSTLQKDIPSVYFCYFCYKLRPFDPNLSWESQAHEEILSWEHQAHGETPNIFPYLHWLPHTCHVDHVFLPEQFYHLMHKYNICFMEANLVMRRHFHGFSHGISLKSLERYESCEDVLELNCINLPGYRRLHVYLPFARRSISDAKTQLSGDDFKALQIKKNIWRFFFRSIPKIIDNKLYVARFFTITGPLVSEERLKKVISSMSIPICHHLTCSAFPSCCYNQNSLPKCLYDCLSIQQSGLYLQEDGKEIEFDPEQETCLLCSTDYRISLNRGISDNETNLNISIYHCLGSCLSPNDNLWLSFAGRAPSFPIKVNTRTLKLDRGSILRKWHEAARVEDEGEDEVTADMV